uniref:Peptidase S9A N-terminal domain-containing protein n=1 Tax=Setaria viridis TaxID=4556 RepID=A0A4U6VH95_SETVI|nr:hypothetical protein SEVIR_4G302700v2 [Setaria viridis]
MLFGLLEIFLNYLLGKQPKMDNHIAVYERENDLPKVTVYRLPAIGESIGQLQGGRTIDFIDPTYAVDPEESEFHSSVIRFHYSSMRTPPSVYDYDMDSGVSVLKKIKPVLGGFDASNYVTERKWAAAADHSDPDARSVQKRSCEA